MKWLTRRFQRQIGVDWLKRTFLDAAPVAMDPAERALRHLEEAMELAQALGVPEEQAYQLVEYTYGRPVGEVRQEVGGSIVTLASLCDCVGVDMIEEAWREFHRCQRLEVMEKIRSKQVTKRLHNVGGTPPVGYT